MVQEKEQQEHTWKCLLLCSIEETKSDKFETTFKIE